MHFRHKTCNGSKLVCKVRDTPKRCSLISIFTLILKLIMVQIASRFSVKSFYGQNLLQKAFFQHQSDLKNSRSSLMLDDVIPDTKRHCT